MGHLLLAACHRDHPVIGEIEGTLSRAADDATDPQVASLRVLDLGNGPRIGRVRAAIGLGWQARDRLREIERATRKPIDAVVEVCLCGHHHLLGLGRVGVPTVRVRPGGTPPTWLDRLAAAEGTGVVRSTASSGSDTDAIMARIHDTLEAARRPPHVERKPDNHATTGKP